MSRSFTLSLLWIFLLAISAGCSRSNPSSSANKMISGAVFGPDDRTAADDDMPVYSGVVHITLTQSHWCSGFAITPRIVITAAHCLEKNRQVKSVDFGNGKGSFFHPWQKKISLDEAPFVAKNFFDSTGPNGGLIQDDYAILHLSEDAPEGTTFLEIASADDLVVGRAAMSIGYPQDARKVDESYHKIVDKNCTITGFEDDRILSDCAIEPGNSGGPLMVNTATGWKVAGICSYVIGGTGNVHYPTYTPEHANRFVNITKYIDEIRAQIK